MLLRPKRRSQKRLRVEPLEKRLMLSGDVFLEFVDGDLVITSDDPSSDLYIDMYFSTNNENYTVTLITTDSTIYVEGEHYTNDMFGDNQWSCHLDSGNIHVITNGNDNTVFFTGEANNVSIETGEGNDQVYLTTDVENLSVDLGAGNDHFELRALSSIHTQLVLDAGTGDDYISLNEISLVETAQLNGGEGNDKLDWWTSSHQEETEFPNVTATGFERLPEGLASSPEEPAPEPEEPEPELASNVTVEIIDGNLVITGTEDHDSIRIARTTTGSYEVKGNQIYIDGEWVWTTVINGQEGPIVFDDVTGDVVISLGDGDDSVMLSDEIDHNLTINMGAGDDLVTLESDVGGNVTVDMGAGDDHFWESRMSIGDPNEPAPTSLDDVAGIIQGNLSVDLGSGKDRGDFGRLGIVGETHIIGATGDDIIDITRVVAQGPINVTTGEGDDQVFVSGSSLDTLTVSLGEGNDILSLRTANVSGTATLTGGPGTDSINDDYLNENTAGAWNVAGFENVDDYVSPNTTSNVTVEIINGDLVISGDELANGVSITRSDDGGYVITGLEREIDDVTVQTLINGIDSPAMFYDLSGSIVVSLGDGDDLFTIDGVIGIMERKSGLSVPYTNDVQMNFIRSDRFDPHITTIHGDLIIDMGAGNDIIELTTIDVDGDISITTGTGDDDVCCRGVWVPLEPEPDLDPTYWIVGDELPPEPNYTYTGTRGICQGNVAIDTGSGNDQVILDNVAIYGDTQISAGTDDDVVGFYSISTNGCVTIETKGGADEVGFYHSCWFGSDVTISTAEGDDAVIARMGLGIIKGNLNIHTGEGIDDISLEDLQSEGNVQIETSNGDDIVRIIGFDPLSMTTLSTEPTSVDANDSLLTSLLSYVDNLAVSLGNGHDILTIENFSISGTATLTGGPGTDSINDDYLDVNTADMWDVFDFENVDDYVSTVVTTNVTVAVVDGNLIVIGDDGDNRIIIRQTGDGEYQISGQRYMLSDKIVRDTTANGHFKLVVESVTGSVIVSLGNGDDKVWLSGTLPNDLTIDMGMGNDGVYLEGTEILGSIAVFTGTGDDVFTVHLPPYGWNPSAYPPLNISIPDQLDGDSSTVTNSVPGSDPYYVKVHGDVMINMGQGQDNVAIESMELDKNLDINTGLGDDLVWLGVDFVHPSYQTGCLITGTAMLNGGPGIDTLNEDFLDANTAGQWNVLWFENVDMAVRDAGACPKSNLLEKLTHGPAPRQLQTTVRHKLIDPRESLFDINEILENDIHELALSNDTSAAEDLAVSREPAQQTLAYDLALSAWDSMSTQRQHEQQDDDKDDELRMLLTE